MIVVDDDEGEVPLELFVGRAHGFQQVAVVVALDQVDHDLGIGLGPERVAFSLERPLQLAVVLDDPVQHDRELAVVAAGQRVGVLLGDCAVGRPAGVAEPGRRDGAVRAGGVLEHLEVTDRPHVVEPIVLAEGEPGGVVTAVLEPLEALEKEVLTRSPSDVPDDPAHARCLP